MVFKGWRSAFGEGEEGSVAFDGVERVGLAGWIERKVVFRGMLVHGLLVTKGLSSVLVPREGAVRKGEGAIELQDFCN